MTEAREESSRAPPSGADETLAVTTSLERILRSPELHASARQQRLLRFLVEETLAGHANRIKAFTLATVVLGRDQNFDPQSDPVVRIEMGQLRRHLVRYYLTEGQADPLRIVIPKGSYVPRFEAAAPSDTRPPADTASGRTRTLPYAVAALVLVLMVLPFAFISGLVPTRDAPDNRKAAMELTLGGPALRVGAFTNSSGDATLDSFAMGLSVDVMAALARFKTLRVFAEAPTRDGNTPPIDYRLSGSVARDEEAVRTTLQLFDMKSGQLLWATTYSLTRLDVALGAPDVAGRIAQALGDPYGVIFNLEGRRTAMLPGNATAVHSCVQTFYVYIETEAVEMHRRMRDCLESATQDRPNFGEGWTDLAFIYVDEVRLGHNLISTPPPLDRAIAAAQRAIALEQDNARAHLALSLAYWFKAERAKSVIEADLALSLNSNDPLIMAEVGVRRALAGNTAGGVALVRQAMDNSTGRPAKYRLLYAVNSYLGNDYERALAEALRGGVPDCAVTQLLLPAIYGKLGRLDDATSRWMALSARQPNFAMNPRGFLLDRGLNASLVDAMLAGYKEAGLLGF